MTSKYTYHYQGDVLVINDHGGPRSVTNDMEKILAVIHMNEARDLTSAKIIYSDSMGLYDCVIAINMGTIKRPEYKIDFFVWGLKNEADAVNKINQQFQLEANALDALKQCFNQSQ